MGRKGMPVPAGFRRSPAMDQGGLMEAEAARASEAASPPGARARGMLRERSTGEIGQARGFPSAYNEMRCGQGESGGKTKGPPGAKAGQPPSVLRRTNAAPT
jgi:hypothetical protein